MVEVSRLKYLKYFSNLSFSHFAMIYCFIVDFFLFFVCDIPNKLWY